MARYPAIASLRAEMTAAGFAAIEEEEVELAYDLTDLSPYRERAFSALHLIAPEAFHRGLERMEADLARGAIRALSSYTLLWAVRPTTLCSSSA
jgi:hypothetical protein